MKSEAQEIEEAMLKDKMKLTDFQQTEQDLNDEVSRQSYLEYIHRVEAKDAKQNERTCGGTGTKRSAYDADCEPGCSQSPLAKIRSRESSSEITNMSEWEFAAENDADESALLARVMAISQREYLEKQKEKAQLSRGDDDKAGTSKS
ncbi:hypothetical protein AB6A40_006573 [Gnathostoma spinigerum]|uniref:Uncharacterized protein n=1 Tax=Gnathostoma spinigerum TaxID=75299 RepID=A0ABD6ERF7_9BILA